MSDLLDLKPDLETAARYIDLLAGVCAAVHFQTFPDDEKIKHRRDLAGCFFGTLAANAKRLEQLNRSGAGVYVTINQTNGRGRKADDVVALRALFIDGDDIAMPELVPAPSIVVRRSAIRWQAFWLLVPGEPLERFRPAQKALIAFYGSDPGIHDLSRVMRLPGFWHRKHKGGEPDLMVQLEVCEDRRYTIDEVTAGKIPALPVGLPLTPLISDAKAVPTQSATSFDSAVRVVLAGDSPAGGGDGKISSAPDGADVAGRMPALPESPRTPLPRGGVSEFDRAVAYGKKLPGAGVGARNSTLYEVSLKLISHFKITNSEVEQLALDWLHGTCPGPFNDVTDRRTVRNAIAFAERGKLVASKWTAPKTGGERFEPPADYADDPSQRGDEFADVVTEEFLGMEVGDVVGIPELVEGPIEVRDERSPDSSGDDREASEDVAGVGHHDVEGGEAGFDGDSEAHVEGVEAVLPEAINPHDGSPPPEEDSEKRKRELDAGREWLDKIYPGRLNDSKGKSGIERDDAVMSLIEDLARYLAGANPATLDRIRDQVTDDLDITCRAYDLMFRTARARQIRERGMSSDGDDSDWTSFAKKYVDSWCGEMAIVRWKMFWYEWRPGYGCYKQHEDEWMRAQVVPFLKENGVLVTTTSISNFLESFRAIVYVDPKIEAPCWIRNVDGDVRRENGIYVSMLNGILDIETVKRVEGDILEHRPLMPHTPDYFSLNSLPYAFDAMATAPRFEAALQQWQPRNERDPDGVRLRLLQDWAGYIFMPGQREQVFLLFVGPGGDGKSQLLLIMRALAGDENTSAVGLEGFDPRNQFYMEALLNKMLNIVADANYIERMTTGTLKCITGGDPIAVNRKLKSVITVRLNVKLMISCNELPGFGDRSEGIWRRMLILDFVPVPTAKVEKDLAARLIRDEMPGIFNWALDGFQRVRACGFRRDGVLLENVAKAKTEIQHERQFFDERVCVMMESDNVLYTKDLMTAYRGWCRDNNFTTFCHPSTMGKSLRKWARETLVTRGVEPEKIDGYLADGRWKGRKAIGERLEYYNGLSLLDDNPS